MFKITNQIIPYKSCIVHGLLAIPFVLLFIYGIKSLFDPKTHRIYKVLSLGLEETVSRNTGYPQKPYHPEQWSIPITVYSPEAMANILGLVGGWEQDNIMLYLQ